VNQVSSLFTASHSIHISIAFKYFYSLPRAEKFSFKSIVSPFNFTHKLRNYKRYHRPLVVNKVDIGADFNCMRLDASNPEE
jgi:hypothetical protein